MPMLKLSPKGASGAKALGQLPSIPDHWCIIETSEELSWSSVPGPWYLCYPDIPEGRQHIRWINRNNDRCFNVEVI